MNAAIRRVCHVPFAMIVIADVIAMMVVVLPPGSMGNHVIVVGGVAVRMIHIDLTQSEKFCWMRCMVEIGSTKKKMKTHMISFLL